MSEHVEYAVGFALSHARVAGHWLDYARGTEQAARAWQEQDPANRRVVDWIYKEQVIIAPARKEQSS